MQVESTEMNTFTLVPCTLLERKLYTMNNASILFVFIDLVNSSNMQSILIYDKDLWVKMHILLLIAQLVKLTR